MAKTVLSAQYCVGETVVVNLEFSITLDLAQQMESSAVDVGSDHYVMADVTFAGESHSCWGVPDMRTMSKT